MISEWSLPERVQNYGTYSIELWCVLSCRPLLVARFPQYINMIARLLSSSMSHVFIKKYFICAVHKRYCTGDTFETLNIDDF